MNYSSIIVVKPVSKALKQGFALLCLMTLFTSPQVIAAEPARLDCLVKPEMYIELSSPVDSVLEKMLVETGDYIKKGQPLVQLEASVERAKVKLAKQQASSKNEIQNRKVQLKYAELSNRRFIEIYSKNPVSRFEKDKSDTELALARIELDKAIEDQKIARINLELARAQLALRTIRSPVDGIVVDRYAMVGESVRERSIMKLAQVNPLKVEIIAPTEYFGLIRKGMQVDIYPERPSNEIFAATVTVVDQLIDPASGSFTVRMALPNPGDQLVGGVKCVASFNFDEPDFSGQDIYSSMINLSE